MLPTRGVGLRTPTQCRNNVHVVTASTEVVPRPTASRPNLVSVGTIIWLSSELMFFAALFAMYFTIRSVDKGLGQPWPKAHLDLALASANTIVLLLSSVTCQAGVFAIERHQLRRSGRIWNPLRWGLREWYALTFLMGLYGLAAVTPPDTTASVPTRQIDRFTVTWQHNGRDAGGRIRTRARTWGIT